MHLPLPDYGDDLILAYHIHLQELQQYSSRQAFRLVSDCNAFGNRSGEDGFSLGFRVEGSEPGGKAENITLLRCIAERNDGGTGRSAGFMLRGDSMQNIVLRDCIANGNSNVSGTVTAGILVESQASDVNVSDMVIDNCILNNNGNLNSLFTGGIIIARPEGTNPLNNILIQNNTSTYNEGAGVGVYGDINNVVIKANEADNNTGIGFDVSQVPNPVLVAMNIAYDNGNGTSVGNYAGVNPAVILQGTQNSLPTAVGAQNLSIIVE